MFFWLGLGVGFQSQWGTGQRLIGLVEVLIWPLGPVVHAGPHGRCGCRRRGNWAAVSVSRAAPRIPRRLARRCPSKRTVFSQCTPRARGVGSCCGGARRQLSGGVLLKCSVMDCWRGCRCLVGGEGGNGSSRTCCPIRRVLPRPSLRR